MTDYPIVDVLYGGQYGSESKRLMIEYYVDRYRPDCIVSSFGPNSGGYVSDGSKWAALPLDFDGKMMLSPGSIINVDDLGKEMSRLKNGGQVLVHRNAAIVTPKAIKDEEKQVRIGSTMTGTMEAAVDKMQRDPDGAAVAINYIEGTLSPYPWMKELLSCKKILVVVPQGHSLSINHGMYPYCTSRNTSPQQGLADAGIPVQWVRQVIGVFRTYPIRVSNRYDDKGDMVGWSGPHYPDQQEIKWSNIGVPPEFTSVSKKVRRVFTFSFLQLWESVMMNGCTAIAMNFLNYLPKDVQEDFIKMVDSETDAKVVWVGVDKTIDDIIPINQYEFDRSWV